MLRDWRAMVELLRELYPKDCTVRLAYEYYFNDRHKSRLVRGLVGRLIVPQNAPLQKSPARLGPSRERRYSGIKADLRVSPWPPPLLGEARRDDYLIGHKLCALIIDQRAALSFSVIFMLRQLGR